jgi:RHS repeat-associated protein
MRALYKFFFLIILVKSFVVQALCQTSSDQNYFSQGTIKKPGITTQAATDALGPADKILQVNYFDGLGRSLQTITVQGTSSGKDLITPVEYDGWGREVKKFLPYPDQGAANGSFRTTMYADQASYYNSASAGSMQDAFPFSQIFYEFSPLGRLKEQGAPGESWQPGGGHTIKMIYSLNTITDDVKKWTLLENTGSFGTYQAGAYNPAELFKTLTTDEQAKQVIEFKDKEGKVILKKVQLTASSETNGTGSSHVGWLCTYYIYDDLSQLRCVIQPKAVEAMNSSGNWTLTATMLSELVFRYEYDARGRMIMKKVPGADPVYMVYDARDRLVMTQDANMRAQGKWMVTVYENTFNRPVQTGLLTDGNSLAYHLGAAYSSVSYPSVTSGFELLTETHYDNYLGLPGGLTSSFNPSGYGTYLNAPSTSPEYGESVPGSPSGLTKGAVTWTSVKVLGTASQFNASVNLYDDKGRVIQNQSMNITGGLDVATSQYSFSGQVLRGHIKHQKSGTNPQSYEVATRNTYDALGRMTLIEKSVAGGSYKQISSLQYNELGQLKTKVLGNSLETLNYDYNIRGWLLGINRADLASNGAGTTRFSFELGYDKQTNSAGKNFTSNQFNGNITGMIWKSAGDGIRRKYDFSYDAANRLMQALFEQNNSGTSWDNTLANYTIRMGDGINTTSAYDANGNILAMTQYGWKIGQPSATPIDNLSYNYQITGAGDALRNKLQRVTDAIAADPSSKLGDFKDGTNSGDDYSYDANGNLLLDNNKSISSISYNYLNLPSGITVTSKGTISYIYDAAGNKLNKVTTDNTIAGKAVTTTTTYIGPFIYESRLTSPSDPGDYTDKLQSISQEEGRIRSSIIPGNPSFVYDYFLKDHLGNVRMVLTDEVKADSYETLSFEDQNIALQNSFWENRQGQTINVSGVRTSVNMNTGQTWAMLTKRSTGSIGATKLLKVMAGDRIHTKVDYFYTTTNSSGTNNGTSALSSIVSSIVSSLTYSSAPSNLIHGGESTINTQLSGNNDLNNAVNVGATTNPSNGSQQAPKAYLCVLFFDERFQFDKDHSVVVPVNYTPNQRVTIDKTFSNAIGVVKSGYAYIYFTNESDETVYFDNFYLSHERGPIVEETHYYPFGLTMAGISSKAVGFGGVENKKRFNGGTELNTAFDINLYETNFRSLDPQLGRFWQVDLYGDITAESSPYAFGNNNPLTFNDPLGLYNDTTGKNPEVMPTVTITTKARIPDQFLPYLHFPTGATPALANSKERPLALNDKPHSVLRDYLRGTGATYRVYPSWHRMTKRLMNADQVVRAKVAFYKKYATNYQNGTNLAGVKEHYKADFGIAGFVNAGLDIVEQFVGGMDIDIIVDEKGQNLLFIASNTTGRTSEYYHLASDIQRKSGEITPEGDLYQKYLWSEPINKAFGNMKDLNLWQDMIEDARIK